MTGTRVRIIHETNPHKYYPAIVQLARAGRIELTGTHRNSVFKEWIRSGLRDRTPLAERSERSIKDLWYRLKSPFIKGEVMVYGFAPWDWRVLLAIPQLRKNQIIYHTSWHDWSDISTPRQYWVFNKILKSFWMRFLNHRNTRIVTVLERSRKELEDNFGLNSEVIPHAVDAEFYYSNNKTLDVDTENLLRLLFVGELSHKKGLSRLLNLYRQLPGERCSLTIIGDGPLRKECIEASQRHSNIKYLGPIRDRKKLASEVAKCQLLVLLSREEKGWVELFGIVIVEALAAGLGVISSRHIGPLSILGDTDNGLFEDDDNEGPLSLIQGFLDQPHLVDEFRESQSAHARPYKIENVADKWFSVLSEARTAQ